MANPLAPRTFRYLETDGVAAITLTRPERLNALTFEIYAELRDLFAALRTHDSVKAVMITGQGRGFCSGGDVRDIIGKLVSMDSKELLEFTRMTGAVVENIRRCRKPVVAGINGVAAGAGAVIALACDLRMMADDAEITFLFPRVGLSGADMGAAYLLPRIVGLGRAAEILFGGEPVPAARALEIGLVNRLLPSDHVALEAFEWAKWFATGPSLAHAMTKEMLQREADMDLSASIEAEAVVQAQLMGTRDFQEAYQAILAKRTPRFEGC